MVQETKPRRAVVAKAEARRAIAEAERQQRKLRAALARKLKAEKAAAAKQTPEEKAAAAKQTPEEAQSEAKKKVFSDRLRRLIEEKVEMSVLDFARWAFGIYVIKQQIKEWNAEYCTVDNIFGSAAMEIFEHAATLVVENALQQPMDGFEVEFQKLKTSSDDCAVAAVIKEMEDTVVEDAFIMQREYKRLLGYVKRSFRKDGAFVQSMKPMKPIIWYRVLESSAFRKKIEDAMNSFYDRRTHDVNHYCRILKADVEFFTTSPTDCYQGYYQRTRDICISEFVDEQKGVISDFEAEQNERIRDFYKDSNSCDKFLDNERGALYDRIKVFCQVLRDLVEEEVGHTYQPKFDEICGQMLLMNVCLA